jgi:subfamily B ATP-binding cassette protein MsbA
MSISAPPIPEVEPKIVSQSTRARLIGFLRPQRKLILLGVACSLGLAAVNTSVPFLMGKIVDALKSPPQTSAARAILESSVLEVALASVGLYVFRWLASVGQSISFAEVGQRLGLKLRNDIYSHIQGMSMSYFDNQRTGNLISIMNNDVPALQNAILSIKDAITGPVIVIVALGTVLVVSWRLSLLTLILLPPIGLLINVISQKLRFISRETQERLADMTSLAEETISGVRVVRSFAAEEREIKRFNKATNNAKVIYMTGVVRSSVLSPTTDLIGMCGMAGALVVGGHEVAVGQLTLKGLTIFLAMLNQLRNGISSIGSITTNLKTTEGAADRIFTNVLDVPTEVTEAGGAPALADVKGTVEFDDVSFAYVPTRPVIRNISFEMAPGEIVAVVGPSGAGKSTLADLIPRFYDPTSGSISIDGVDVKSVTLKSLRRQIGIVPQETMLFNASVRENIGYSMPDATEAQIIEAAKNANAHDFIMDMPNGYDTMVGDRGVQLSGGQRQRLAIARAVLFDPRILILDEATSSLDTASEAEVQKALEILMLGRTTLVIAHRLSTIVKAHKILVLDAGRIVENGTHSQLMTLGGVYAQLYDKQYRTRAIV